MRRLTALAACAAVLTFGAGSAAGAQSSPVTIQSCTVLRARPPVGPPRFWYPWGPVVRRGAPVVDGVRIVYVNHRSVAADRVAFAVDYRGDRQHIVDVGTFSPNVTIDHSFGNFSGDAYLGPNPNRCAVRAVRFADGTVWRSLQAGS